MTSPTRYDQLNSILAPQRSPRWGGLALKPTEQETSARAQLMQALSDVPTGNALPILHEVHEALSALLADGKTTIIDLGAIPFSAGDEKVLEAFLGAGEVRATLNVLGESVVEESAIPGVWRVDHYDEDGETQSRFIEITYMPEILKTQEADARLGLERLAGRLADEGDAN